MAGNDAVLTPTPLPRGLKRLAEIAHDLNNLLTILPRLPRAGGPSVFGNPEKIRAMVLNLAKNGAEAGGKVSIVLGTVDGQAEIRVQDTGKGIPQSVIEPLIQPRSPDSSSAGVLSDKGEAGHGHGLEKVKREVEEMGGAIHIHAEPGKGTWVTLRFPPLEEAGAGAVANVYVRLRTAA